jgi:hypothetical protein
MNILTPRQIARSIFMRLPPVQRLLAERDALAKAHGFAPPGHFYSPIVSIAELSKDESRIFGEMPRVIPGIELHETEQLQLLAQFEHYYPSIPFPATKSEGARYYFDNPAYTYSDAIILHCMIRHLKPRRIVEVGSGFSSCATLDTNEAFFDNSIAITFIEPHPELLESLITISDRERVSVIPKRLQDVPLDVFAQLEANDILFIDSTHVSKVGSDVNRAFFEILPALGRGVHIHIHDIFHPFEYPKEWIFGGRSWNEIYMLRAFLQYNDKFRVVFLNTFMEYFHEERFRETMPLCLINRGGSIWIRKE